jgi:FtsZ-interacting cell division protein ZipA
LNKLNDLTISLLAIGLGLIVLVILFNWWQERKMRKVTEKQFSATSSDLLMDDFADDVFEETAVLIEPSTKIKDVVDRYVTDDVRLPDEVEFKIDLGDFEHESVVIEEAPDVVDPDVVEEVHAGIQVPSEPVAETPVRSNGLPESVNKDVDLTALFFLPTPANGKRLRQFLIGLVNLDKPIHAYGLDSSQVWHPLTLEQEAVEFTKASYSLQLADRAGAVSADTLNRFQQMVAEIAYELSAQVEWIGTQEPLEFAQALDTFCLEVDKTIGFHILNGASGRFTGTKFKGLAEANGLALKDDGAFYAKSKNGQSAFKVINMENNPFGSDMLKSVALKGVTFQMEIALTESCTETFNSMVLMAKSMAHSLSATLVDDHQRELSDAKIEKIRQQLRLIQVQMTVKGIPPGSPVALRLFV